MSRALYSPIKKGSPAKKVSRFSVLKICRNYSEFGLDVSSYFKGLDTIDLYKCEETGYRFFTPFDIVGDVQFYKDLRKRWNELFGNRCTQFRWEHKQALQYLTKDDNVLDIGSAEGRFLNLLKMNEIKGFGLELNPDLVEECRAKGLNADNTLIQHHATDHLDCYSTVCAFQVLEHITQTHDFLQAAISTLKKGGRLIIGVPNNNPYLYVFDKYNTLNLPPHHMGLWDEKSLTALETIFPLKLECIKFEPLELTYNKLSDSQIKHLHVFFKLILKIMPNLMKGVLCKFLKGRNIFVVYRKI